MSYLPPDRINLARSVIRKNLRNFYKKYGHAPCKEASLILYEEGFGQVCTLTAGREDFSEYWHCVVVNQVNGIIDLTGSYLYRDGRRPIYLTKPRVVKAATIRRKSTTEKMNFWRRILVPVVDFRFPLFEREEIEKMFSVQSPCLEA